MASSKVDFSPSKFRFGGLALSLSTNISFANQLGKSALFPLLQSAWSFSLGALGFIVAWIITHFFLQPLLNFRSLRGTVIRQMALYGNVRARWKEPKENTWSVPIEIEISDKDTARLEEAERIFRQLASEMREFALNAGSVVWLMQLCGYDPLKASKGLFGVANSIGTQGRNREWQKRTVTDALRIKPV